MFLKKKKKGAIWTQRNKEETQERRPCEGRDRAWSDTSTNQGKPMIVRSHQR